MDTTANTFTKRNNAKRAAEAMIAKGTAPALDYGIKQIDNPGHSDDGRFEIVWKTGNAATAVSEADVASAEQNWSGPGWTTDEIETEIAEATAEADADPFARIRAREDIEALGTGRASSVAGRTRSRSSGRGSLSASARLGAPARGAVMGIARRHEPRPAAARSQPCCRRLGAPPAHLRPVHRGLRHGRSQDGKGSSRHSPKLGVAASAFGASRPL
jgi:hypothetical protein